MEIDKLKEIILNQAITGKLLLQDSTYQPASELINHLREAKQELIKNKLISKDKNSSFIFRKDNSFFELVDGVEKNIDDEIPFEIPESWEWVRLGEVADITLGKTPETAIAENWSDSEKGIKWFSISDLNNGIEQIEPKKYISQKAFKEFFNSKYAKKGAFLFSFKLTIGKKTITTENVTHNEAIASIEPFFDKNYALRNYLFWLLETFSKFVEKTSAIKGQTLNKKKLEKILIPIPPIQEQQRIVEKLEILFSKIDELEKINVSYKTNISSLSSTINDIVLNQAIKGKLVSQNALDQPASEVLKELKQKKEELIDKKLISKDKNSSFIFRKDNSFFELIDGVEKNIDDEIPFEIPESWEWVRLWNIGDWKSGITPLRTNRDYYKDGTFNWLRVEDIGDKYLTKETDIKITKKAIEDHNLRILEKGNIVFSIYTGPSIGKVSIVDGLYTSNQAILGMKPFLNSIVEWVYYWLISNRKFYQSIATGTAQKNLSKDKLINTLIAFPPIQEQQRIVEKLEKIFKEIKELEDLIKS